MAASSLPDLVASCAHVRAREAAEDNNLVDAMETADGEQPPEPSESGKPKLMFKIASKSRPPPPRRRVRSASRDVFFFLCVCASGYRTVDALLQRLFEADLEQEDGDADAHDANGNFANPAFGAA